VSASQPLQYEDVFQLEFVSQPQINKDGSEVVFVRNRFDQALDKRMGSLWLSQTKTGQLRPIVTEQADISAPQWSPDGKKLLFVSAASGKPQIHVRWLDSGQMGQISHSSGANRY
jgi:dipeptidyl aminopeptidase/acylaminoacyl peptidase